MKNWKVIVWLVLFFPLGAYFMWRYSSWNIHLKYGISIFLGLLTTLFIFAGGVFLLFFYSGFGSLFYFLATFKNSPKKQKISYLVASILLFGSSIALIPTTESAESQQPEINIVQEESSAKKTADAQKQAEEKLAAEKKRQTEKELQAETLKEARDALILAESAPTRENYNKASTLIVALTTKDSMMDGRLDAVKQTVEAEEKIVADAKAQAEVDKAAAEQARIAEEQRVQEEAQRVAEEQRLAAEQAAVEENRVAQAAAAAPQQDNTGQRVLVTPTGSKYHNHKCGNGTYTDASLEDAISRGLQPCSKCF